MATLARTLTLLAGLGLGLGGATSLLAPACLILDKCPVITTAGTDWCVVLMDAQMWPIGQPELAEPVEGGPFKSCVCMHDGESEILDDEAPADYYMELLAGVQQPDPTPWECEAEFGDGETGGPVREPVDVVEPEVTR